MSLTVATVLKTGGEYKVEHVQRLREQVFRVSPEARFECLSDHPRAQTSPLYHDWPNWWSKIELFRPGRFRGPVVYLDLDSTVIRPLELLVRDRFTMLADFNKPAFRGSGVMAWHSDAPPRVYETFRSNPREFTGRYKRWPLLGDQGFIFDLLGSVNTFGPDEVVSYKKHVKPGLPIPDDCSVIAFHGRPRPWDVEEVCL